MSLPLAGAQEPFWIKATVRFCRLWWARSRSRCSMESNRPLLKVGAAKTMWLYRKHWDST